jgi:hypothetical protein
LNAICLGLLSGYITNIALVDKGQFHLLSGDALHGLCQFTGLGSVLFIGRCDQ